MSFKDVAKRRIGVETIVAAVAAVTTGAAVFLMPVAILQEAVSASGLPSLLPPLEPPLGDRARLGLALVAAGLTFGLVVVLTRLIVRNKPVEPVRKREVGEPVPPRVRRRDSHPDAPTRAPFLVTRDAGVDAREITAPWPEEIDSGALVSRRIRAGRPAEVAPVDEHPTADDIFEDESELVVDQVLSEIESGRPYETEIEPEPEPEPEPEQALPPLEVEPEPMREPETPRRPAWLDDAVPQPRAGGEQSLGDLLARFEQAMERRSARPARAPAAAVEEEASDDRLRSALENLKRFAPRQG